MLMLVLMVIHERDNCRAGHPRNHSRNCVIYAFLHERERCELFWQRVKRRVTWCQEFFSITQCQVTQQCSEFRTFNR